MPEKGSPFIGGPSALDFVETVVPVGSDGKFLEIYGQMIHIKEGNCRFWVQFDGQKPIPLEVGLGRRKLDGSYFRKVRIFHEEETEQSISFYYGTDEVIDQRLNTLIERDVTMTSRLPRTVLVGVETDLDPGDTATFTGLYLNKHRCQLILTNTHATEELKVRAPEATLSGPGSDVNVATLRPKVPWTVPTSDTVKVQNPATNANTITLEVAGTHYVD